jgi:catechol 2,3-dioxygenase-like lactoylglutathione lyase family enzyme
MKLRTEEPWMPAPTYGRSLEGLTVNLLVQDIGISLAFQRDVLGVEVVYSDPDIAVLRFRDAEWMLHADHTYEDHPLHGSLNSDIPRGIGVELRLHGRDPDAAETAARELGYTILDGTSDKPHGLREAYLIDPDGYIWVPDIPTTE